MLGGSLLHPIQFVKAAIFVCLLIALPLGGNAQAAAEDSKPATDGWDDWPCQSHQLISYETSKSKLLLHLDPVNGSVLLDFREFAVDQGLVLTFEEWDDLSHSLQDDRLTSSSVVVLKKLVRHRHSTWWMAYRVLAEFRIVGGDNLGLESPWGVEADSILAFLEIADAGGSVDPAVVAEVTSALAAESRSRLPTSLEEVTFSTGLLFASRKLLPAGAAGPAIETALLCTVRVGDGAFTKKGDLLDYLNVRMDRDSRRRVLYAIIHCPQDGDQAALLEALKRVPEALHDRWSIHGGLQKSPSHEFSLPVQDLVTAALQLPQLVGNHPLDWGTQLNNDLKDLEDEVRENKRKFSRPSTAHGDDARDRILEQLAEIRAYLEPHLKD